ncbi:MAG TPA: flavin reductase family protein [Vicinamibacteria bacterium]|nr:flavin reductase family protein [Vicinamibacteria bacterium]
MAVDLSTFRRTLGQFASGITVVTSRDAAGRPAGLTANAFCSVSLDPPLVLVCVDHRSEVSEALRDSGLFGVSVLSEGQEDWSRRFASGGPEKFMDAGLLTGVHGTLLVPDALAHLECRVRAAYPEGDHTIWVGEVLGLAVIPGRPLLYHASAYRRLDGEGGVGETETGAHVRDRV